MSRIYNKKGKAYGEKNIPVREEKDEEELNKPYEGEISLNAFMKIAKRKEELCEKCIKEMKEFEEKNGTVARTSEIPSYSDFQKAYDELMIVGWEVKYCERNAIIWYNIGMRNERKTWTIKEVWSKNILSDYKQFFERTITWEGTLEEYAQHYGLNIKYSNLQYRSKDRFFTGVAGRNIPEELSTNYWANLEVWIESCS